METKGSQNNSIRSTAGDKAKNAPWLRSEPLISLFNSNSNQEQQDPHAALPMLTDRRETATKQAWVFNSHTPSQF
jgi:hypothetical protein